MIDFAEKFVIPIVVGGMANIEQTHSLPRLTVRNVCGTRAIEASIATKSVPTRTFSRTWWQGLKCTVFKRGHFDGVRPHDPSHGGSMIWINWHFTGTNGKCFAWILVHLKQQWIWMVSNHIAGTTTTTRAGTKMCLVRPMSNSRDIVVWPSPVAKAIKEQKVMLTLAVLS
jgi:hypothetical protein